MRGIALCCAAIGLAGCSLLLSTSELNEPGAAPAEAGTPSPAEGGADGSSSSGDASSDGASGRRFCETLSPAPKHCSDFDKAGDAVNAGWNDVAIDPPSVGSVTLDAIGRAGSSALVKIDQSDT